MNIRSYAEYLGSFLDDYVSKSKCKGLVVGVSGGIDSAVVVNLIKKYCKCDLLGIILPCEEGSNIEDAILVCKEAKINYKVVDLSKIIMQFNKIEGFDEKNELANSNIKPRIRMTALYYFAQLNNYLVCGTDNADEYYTGYFTKFGDGAYDINPLRYLTKTQIYELADILNINKKIIDKKPSADLIVNQTDEDDLKVSYKEIDDFLDGKEISKEKKDRILSLHLASEHKRNLPIFPKEFEK